MTVTAKLPSLGPSGERLMVIECACSSAPTQCDDCEAWAAIGAGTLVHLQGAPDLPVYEVLEVTEDQLLVTHNTRREAFWIDREEAFSD